MNKRISERMDTFMDVDEPEETPSGADETRPPGGVARPQPPENPTEDEADLGETPPWSAPPFLEADPEEPAKTRPIASKIMEPVSDEEPRLRAAKRCHVGARRDRNEDSCLLYVAESGGHFASLPFGLFIVADGMGGHSDGHVASNIAMRTAAAHVLTNIYMPLLQDDNQKAKPPIQEVLEQAVQKANKAVFEHDAEVDSGTTLTIALVFGRRLHVAHVGDSRLYLLANGRLESITSDHSLVQRLQDVGQLTAEEATFYRYGHVLLKAVGQAEEVEADVYMRLLPKSGRLLLCSDGLSGFVPEAELRAILEQPDAPLQEVADKLFEAAMEMGGFDNITAVVVDFEM
jgi:PPM family protein phosphatase